MTPINKLSLGLHDHQILRNVIQTKEMAPRDVEKWNISSIDTGIREACNNFLLACQSSSLRLPEIACILESLSLALIKIHV